MKKIIYSAQLSNTHDFDNTVSIDLTHMCNFDCWYCYDRNNRNNLKNKNIFINIQDIKLFFDSYMTISKNKIINVNLLGGEPTLHKKLFEIVSLISSYNCVKLLRITTNASKEIEYYRDLQNISKKIIINFSYHENKLFTFEEFLKKCNNLQNNLEISYMINPDLDVKILKERKLLLKNLSVAYISLTGVSYDKETFSETFESSFSQFRLLKVKYEDGSSSLLQPNIFLQQNINPFLGMKCDAFKEYWKISPYGKIRVGCEEFINDKYIEEFDLNIESLQKFYKTFDKKRCKMKTCGCFYHSKKYI